LIGYHNTEEQKTEVMNMLGDLRSSSVASLPATIKDVKVLEPSRETDFMPYLNYMNDEISKVFLFGTRTMSASNSAGAYSATEAHANEADDRADDIAKFCIKILNKQIIPNLVRINFGVQDKYPFAKYGSQDSDSPNDYLDRVNKASLSKTKISISKKEWYEKSGISRPNPDIPDDELIIGDEGGSGTINFSESAARPRKRVKGFQRSKATA
jgi:phage gp29-like protein